LAIVAFAGANGDEAASKTGGDNFPPRLFVPFIAASIVDE
jgi:hypothetical protein